MTRYLTTEEVIEIHHNLMLAERQQAILIAPAKLEAAVARPQATVFGEEAYPRLAEKAAALLESIAIGHPFIDGNKRVAFAAMDVFLRLNGVRVATDEVEMYALVVGVASGEMKGVETIAERLRLLYGPTLT